MYAWSKSRITERDVESALEEENEEEEEENELKEASILYSMQYVQKSSTLCAQLYRNGQLCQTSMADNLEYFELDGMVQECERVFKWICGDDDAVFFPISLYE